MFEDSTFESNGTIRTRSRGWMLASFTFYSSILLALILIPLVYPEALPRQAIAFLMEVPPPPPAPTPSPQHQAARIVSATAFQDPFAAPRVIPRTIVIPSTPDPEGPGNNVAMWDPGSTPGGDGPFHPQPAPRVVPDVKTVLHVPSTLAQGLLLNKVVPQYPQLARAMRAEGTVVLAATISRDGTIEHLRVVSGLPVLQQAALDAVSRWRYRPYLLNGNPVEVETTVNVVFKLSS
ncbi:MAG: TonB family protein [Terracidiphilus sp.]|nr:TonB family protein [Terracidiphilus sp.]